MEKQLQFRCDKTTLLLDGLPATTSYSVRFNESEIKAFFENNKEYSSDNLLIGIHGKPSFSPTVVPASETNGADKK